MFYLPGVVKAMDGRFYARAFGRGLAWATQGPRPRLIEAHFVWPDGVGAWQVAREMGVPFFCTIRGKLVSQIVDRAKRRQIREMLLAADGLIAVSRSLAALADEVAGRALGVRVIPNGVDTEMFRRMESARCREGILGTASARNTASARGTACDAAYQANAARPSAQARAACGWSDAARYVVSVGHLQALKGFHRLVEVWPEVRRRAGDVRLVLVGGEAGEPGYLRRLRRLIEAAGLGTTGGGEFVTVTGRVEPQRVATLLNAADLFVLASRSEGWCNAIVEALACGCPVVVTDVGGNREIVRDGCLGRLVPPGDGEALAEAVCGALARDWDRPTIAEAGGRRDWQQVARECVDVFKSVP
jgi:glycosyltransferase involved in cell wall biosynthesis